MAKKLEAKAGVLLCVVQFCTSKNLQSQDQGKTDSFQGIEIKDF